MAADTGRCAVEGPPTTRAELVAAVKRRTGLDCTTDCGVWSSQVVDKAPTRYNVSLTIWGRGPTLEDAIAAIWEQVDRTWETQTVMPLDPDWPPHSTPAESGTRRREW